MQHAASEPLSADDVTVLEYPPQATDPIKYEVRCLAPNPYDLSFNQLYEPDTAKRNAYYRRMGAIFAAYNLRTILAPKPKFNAVVGSPGLFTEEFHLPFDVTIKRPSVLVEGTEISEFQGGAFTAGGCPFLVLTFIDEKGQARLLFAHAGTGSLIDFEHAVHLNAPRPHYSVVDALVDYAVAEGGQPEWMTLRCFFSIPCEAYQYSMKNPVHGEENKVLFTHLSNKYGETSFFETYDGHEHFNLEKLVEVQAHARNIVRVSSHCTLPKKGRFAHTRHAVPELSGLARNLEIIIVC